MKGLYAMKNKKDRITKKEVKRLLKKRSALREAMGFVSETGVRDRPVGRQRRDGRNRELFLRFFDEAREA